MTLKELEDIEKEIRQGMSGTIKYIDSVILSQKNTMSKEEKAQIKLNAIDIFSTSLRLIKQEKEKLNKN